MRTSHTELQHLLHLLELEQTEELNRYQTQIQATPLQERRKRGLAWYPVVLSELRYGLGQTMLLEIERTSELGKPHVFQTGQVAALFREAEGQRQPELLTGVISNLQPDRLTLAINQEELPDWVEDGKLGLDVCFDETTWRTMRQAVRQVQSANHDRLAELREIVLGYQPALFDPSIAKVSFEHLNPAQQTAVDKAIQARDLAIIHGPPGTGKTTTLVAAIQGILQTENQVLACAPSNTAVDVLTAQLTEQGIKVLRLGHPARVSESQQSHTLDTLLAAHPQASVLKELRQEAQQTRKQAQKFKRNFGPQQRQEREQAWDAVRSLRRETRELEKRILHDVLNDAQVITCTLVGADLEVLKGRTFNTVCLDEAAQALEGASWIPILKAQRVILAGDHQQLPPTVTSAQAAKEGLMLTLFEKAIQRQPECAQLLSIQYRMPTQIMGFSSNEFYEGELQAHESVADEHLLPEELPLEFIDTAGCGYDEQLATESQSLANPEEAALLVRHLTQLELALKGAGLDPGSLTVGIIAPYRAQVDELKTQLPSELQQAFATLNIHSVDGFQGQERDIIYLSLTRSNPEGEIGFLADTRRMNVALTRARRKLVVLGDSATLANHSFYERFHQYSEELGAWRSAWEFMS